MLSEGPVLLAPLLQRQVPVHSRVDLLVGRLHDAERHGDDGGHGPADYHEGFLAGFRQEEQRDRQKDEQQDRKSTRLNSSHSQISYAVFCLKKKKNKIKNKFSKRDIECH